MNSIKSSNVTKVEMKHSKASWTMLAIDSVNANMYITYHYDWIANEAMFVSFHFGYFVRLIVGRAIMMNDTDAAAQLQ